MKTQLPHKLLGVLFLFSFLFFVDVPLHDLSRIEERREESALGEGTRKVHDAGRLAAGDNEQSRDERAEKCP